MIIFEKVFGQSWGQIAPVFKRHYGTVAFSDQKTVVTGFMVIEMSRLIKFFAPFMRLFGLLIPFEGRFPATVSFYSDGEAFVFDRQVTLPNGKIYAFKSKMQPLGGNMMLEKMALGFRWKAAYSYADNQVVIAHLGYQFFGLPLPLELIFGRGDAYEIAIDNTRFSMKMTMVHPIFKQIYAYSGEFEVL